MATCPCSYSRLEHIINYTYNTVSLFSPCMASLYMEYYHTPWYLVAVDCLQDNSKLIGIRPLHVQVSCCELHSMRSVAVLVAISIFAATGSCCSRGRDVDNSGLFSYTISDFHVDITLYLLCWPPPFWLL